MSICVGVRGLRVCVCARAAIRVRRRQRDGTVVERRVRVWNATVANLTLMALGSSAPEILLSVIEVVGNNFEAGELGPGTIVGSAAYNLLIVPAVCIISTGTRYSPPHHPSSPLLSPSQLKV